MTHILSFIFGLALLAAVLPDQLPPEEATVEPVCQHTIGLEVRTADGSANYSEVRPGDTVCIEAGTRASLRLENFHGEPGLPITFVNYGGAVTIESEQFAGVQFVASEQVRLTGTGTSTRCGSAFPPEEQECGIRILGGQRGVSGRERTGQIEIDHLEISGGSKSGITISNEAPREEWTQYDTRLHDNYIHDMGTEGIYIGSSHYTDGLDPLLIGVEVDHNLVTRTGWDAIQVGSAIEGCAIHDNLISSDSQGNEQGQRSGIMNNPGSTCEIYSNFITDSAASGIYVQGNGGNYVHDNTVVRPGRMEVRGAHAGSGILIATGSSTGERVLVENNLIVEPMGDGVRFTNREGSEHTVRLNTVVDPGGAGVSVSREATVVVSENLLCTGQEGGERCEATQ